MDKEVELFKLTQKIYGRPWEFDGDDFLYGKERARYFELINETLVAEGLDPLVNDEDGNPALTHERMTRVEAAVAAHEEHIRVETAKMGSSRTDS